MVMAGICLRLCSLRKRVSALVSQTFTKPILLLLLLNIVARIPYNLFFQLSRLYLEGGTIGTLVGAAVLSIANVMSPLAGYLGDMKYSRFSVLKCGAYFMIAFSLISLLFLTVFMVIGMSSPMNVLKLWYVAFVIYFLCGYILYMMGYLLLSANFIQFSTDQLRDAPSKCIVLLLYAVLWSDNFSRTLSTSIYINWNNKTFIADFHHGVRYSFVYVSLVLLVMTSTFLVIIVLIFKWKKNWLLKEKIKGNPYKLVVDILLFALRHKSPLRRSAFTFCENDPPSRIDFGKQRYGGPYSTEDVENVKVLLNILKVLVSLGPVFLLDYAARLSSIAYVGTPTNFMEYMNLWEISPNFLSSFINTFTLPLFVFILKPIIETVAPRLLPNFFKKIGLGLLVIIFFFVTYMLYDGIAHTDPAQIFNHCSSNETSTLNHRSFVHIPNRYLKSLQANLLAISNVLLKVSLWEFICSQSPQHMKGLLFGLLFALREHLWTS